MLLGFATNVINFTTLSILTPRIRILYFCVFYRWKWRTRRRVDL